MVLNFYEILKVFPLRHTLCWPTPNCMKLINVVFV
jgi:hypothetical protein